MQVLETSRRALAEKEVLFGDDLSIIQPPSSRMLLLFHSLDSCCMKNDIQGVEKGRSTLILKIYLRTHKNKSLMMTRSLVEALI